LGVIVLSLFYIGLNGRVICYRTSMMWNVSVSWEYSNTANSGRLHQ